MTRVFQPELTWTGERFERDVQIEIRDDGLIGRVGALGLAGAERRSGQAFLPGFVNAHSHAFQRGLRGRGETFPAGAGSFWSWREAMYDLVATMDADTLRPHVRRAFAEMRAAGITSVGEFHYLHHDATEAGFALDDVVLDVAAEVGIRIVLLQAFYQTGDIGQPLEGGQRRFRVRSTQEYWAQMDRLAARLDPVTQSLGVVAHSIRAVGIETIVALHDEAARRGLPFHLHLEEQRREIESCLRHYHQRPMALLNDQLAVSPRVTAVHCTHTAPGDMTTFLEAGGNVCICPLTEANLGDGIADVPLIRRREGRICLGTDSNARLSMLEEMRWLEYVQRLRTESRGVIVDPAGAAAPALLETATKHGAMSLGLRAGAIAPDHLADFVAVDLDAPCLEGWEEETLLGAIILGGGNGCVVETMVGGH